MLIKILSAVAPVIFLLLFIYSKDKKAPEPTDQLLRAFRYGILSALCVMVVMSPFASSGEPSSLWQCAKVSFLEAGIPEEFFKWLFLYILIWRSPQFDEYIDGIIYAVFVSMGFACLENVMYVLPGTMATAFTRALLSVPAHFLFAVIMGYYFSMARFHPERRTCYMIYSFVLPMIAHGLFDTLAFWMDTFDDYSIYSFAFFLFVLLDIWLWRKGARLIRKSVALTDAARAEASDLSFVRAQDAAEAMPAALPLGTVWQDTPVAIYRLAEDESSDVHDEVQYKLLIECRCDAKIIINEKDAFFAKAGTNYRLTLPAGEYTVRYVNLNRYEQMSSRKIVLDRNRRMTIAFNKWECLPATARTLIIGFAAVIALWLFVNH